MNKGGSTKARQLKTKSNFSFAVFTCLWTSFTWAGDNQLAIQDKPGGNQDLAALTQNVQAQLVLSIEQRWPNSTVSVEVNLPSEKLRLSACEDLRITPRSERLVGNVPVSVRCYSPVPWHLFLQAKATVMMPVVVTANPIGRRARLAAADLTLAERNLTSLRGQFLTRIEDAQGLLSIRAQTAGTVLYNTSLTRPKAVSKGQAVAISSGRGSIKIAAHGEALEGGMRGDQIKVRNAQSGREIYAWIVAPGQVSSFWPKTES